MAMGQGPVKVSGENWKRQLTAALVAIVFVAPTVWMLMDRKPPFVRIGGAVQPQDPKPGEWIEIHWQINVTRVCPPKRRFNVTRIIIDGAGKIHEFTPVEGMYGKPGPGRPEGQEQLVRSFQLPTAITPGTATYYSSACFVCNPIHYFWPVCVDTPKLHFNVAKP